MRYRHVVFDIDGTLTDTEYAALVSLRDVILAEQGRDCAMETLKFALGIPGVDAFRILGFKEVRWPMLMADWERGLRAHNDEIDVFPGGRELVRTLAQAGVKLGIATSKTRDQYEKDFERFDIAAYFPVSVTADDTTEHKPGAGPLLHYMKLTGAKPEEMLYIGDSIYDAGTAKAAGVDFALALWGAPDPAVEGKYRPQKPADLLEVIL